MNKLLIFITLIACAALTGCSSGEVTRGGVRIGGGPKRLTPAQNAAFNNYYQLTEKTILAFDAGNYASAILDAKRVLAIPIGNHDSTAETVLAYSLMALDKDQDALNEYGQMYLRGDRESGDLLQYALLLLKHGQWSNALDAYERALKWLDSDKIKEHERLLADNTFSHDNPQPKKLKADIYIAIGMSANVVQNIARKTLPQLGEPNTGSP
jgi:tetratricopeptide (TPR) repeat protein